MFKLNPGPICVRRSFDFIDFGCQRRIRTWQHFAANQSVDKSGFSCSHGTNHTNINVATGAHCNIVINACIVHFLHPLHSWYQQLAFFINNSVRNVVLTDNCFNCCVIFFCNIPKTFLRFGKINSQRCCFYLFAF